MFGGTATIRSTRRLGCPFARPRPAAAASLTRSKIARIASGYSFSPLGLAPVPGPGPTPAPAPGGRAALGAPGGSAQKVKWSSSSFTILGCTAPQRGQARPSVATCAASASRRAGGKPA